VLAFLDSDWDQERSEKRHTVSAWALITVQRYNWPLTATVRPRRLPNIAGLGQIALCCWFLARGGWSDAVEWWMDQ
jgi:hypothetical protein